MPRLSPANLLVLISAAAVRLFRLSCATHPLLRLVKTNLHQKSRLQKPSHAPSHAGEASGELLFLDPRAPTCPRLALTTDVSSRKKKKRVKERKAYPSFVLSYLFFSGIFRWIKVNFPRLLPPFSMGTTTYCGPNTCATSSKAIVYGAMSQVKSKLLFILRMKTTRSSLIVLKIGIARITKSSLGFATLLSLPFISNLVAMKILRMFGIF
jgi:hypothetical protein